jgi:hypothetical protein
MLTLTPDGQTLLFVAATAVLVAGALCAAVLALLIALDSPASRVEGDAP